MNPFHKGKYISKVPSCNTLKGSKKSVQNLNITVNSNQIYLSLIEQFGILEMYIVSSKVVELCWLISNLNQEIGIFKKKYRKSFFLCLNSSEIVFFFKRKLLENVFFYNLCHRIHLRICNSVAVCRASVPTF